MKEVAQRVEAVVTDPIEPPQDQVDPILYGTYQEKLYIEVSLAKAFTFVLLVLKLRWSSKHFVKLRKLTNVCP